MELVARQFLRALRGSRSQLDLALQLGYQGNPITDWERGVINLHLFEWQPWRPTEGESNPRSE